jgi:VIT1/CCC1 family predicted Fe2+/Mn2+ transporter
MSEIETLNENAKKAYLVNDAEQSKNTHIRKTSASQVAHHKEKHAAIGEYIRSIVFGGLDGIITTFAIVAASTGSGLTYFALLIVGFANLIGDAFSMGLGDFFSSRSEIEQSNKMRKKYLWEFENNPQKSKDLMVETFTKKGFIQNDSQRIVEMLSENNRTFVDVMLLELEGICFEEDNASPLRNGIVTFLSFIFFGSIPMICYFFAPNKGTGLTINYFFFISMGLTGISLFILGAIKNIILARSWWRGGFYVLFTGGIATGCAFVVGWLLELLLKV